MPLSALTTAHVTLDAWYNQMRRCSESLTKHAAELSEMRLSATDDERTHLQHLCQHDTAKLQDAKFNLAATLRHAAITLTAISPAPEAAQLCLARIVALASKIAQECQPSPQLGALASQVASLGHQDLPPTTQPAVIDLTADE